MRPGNQRPPTLFTTTEIRIFKAYAALMGLVGMALVAVAPGRVGQVLALALTLVLLPAPPLVVFFFRRRRPPPP